MKKTKDNRGISLIILIITIAVMTVIAGVAIYSSTSDIENSQEQMALAELEEVKHFVGESYLNYTKTKNTNFLVGDKLTSSEATALATRVGVTLISIPNSYNEDEKAYYRLNPTNLLKIGIENSEDTYVVNYVTGEVINETKIKTSSGKALYTYLRKNFNNVDVIAF